MLSVGAPAVAMTTAWTRPLDDGPANSASFHLSESMHGVQRCPSSIHLRINTSLAAVAAATEHIAAYRQDLAYV